MRVLCLPVLLLLLASAAGQHCSLTMWVFQDQASCMNNPSSPLSEATIYADKTCRTVETSSHAELFPGTYIAECLSDGSVEFTMSGCSSSECYASLGQLICDQSLTSISPYYSLAVNKNYSVQDPASQDSGFSCTPINHYTSVVNFTVGFAIFGNCTTSECQGSGPSTSPIGTSSPSFNPTSMTDSLSEAPVTDQPTLNPTKTEVTDSPTESTSSPPPLLAPFPVSTSSPTIAPVETTLAPLPDSTSSPTIAPVETTNPLTTSPVTTSKPSSSSLIPETVGSLSLVLTEMARGLEDDAEQLEWQNVTAAHIEKFYQDDNIRNLSVKITIANQQNMSSGVRRLASSYSLRIDFVANLAYHGEKANGVQLIASSFDSDKDSTVYIEHLQAENDVTYENLNKVELLHNGKSLTVGAPNEANLGIIIGASVGGGVVVLGLGLVTLLFLKKKKAEKKREATTPMSVNEMLPEQSNLSATVPPTSFGTPDTHLTTITLSRSDEVSTLGDPVLAGMQFVDGGGIDEHTASVNDVDYDFVKAQHDRLKSQDSKKSLDSNSYFPSSLERIENDVLSDDNSFEALFQDEDPRMEERFTVIAPPGKLGMVLDTSPGEGPLVHAINDTSVLKGRVRVGDLLTSVDAEDVRTMSATKVSALITQKSQQERTLEFFRRQKR